MSIGLSVRERVWPEIHTSCSRGPRELKFGGSTGGRVGTLVVGDRTDSVHIGRGLCEINV